MVRRRKAISRNWLGMGGAENDLEIEQGPGVRASWTRNATTQHGAARQQGPHQARIEPVQPVALVQGRDRSTPGPMPPDARPNTSGRRPLRRAACGNAAVQAQRHHERERHVLPEDPAPGEMLDVPALQRGRDVERQLEVERIDGDAIGPVACGGILRRMKLKVSGMKQPEARPPRNCIVSSTGRVGESGVSREITAKAMEAPISTRRGP